MEHDAYLYSNLIWPITGGSLEGKYIYLLAIYESNLTGTMTTIDDIHETKKNTEIDLQWYS
jgi:hypothetical protein